MGWNVYDYPSPPPERGARADGECNAKGCPQTISGDFGIWTCADCGDDFCERHIEDLLEQQAALLTGRETEGGSVFLCPACLRDRKKIGAPSALPVLARREVA